MKKYFFIILACSFQLAFSNPLKDSIYANKFHNLLLLSEYEYEDCDACGCSASSGGLGFGSMLNSNFVGVRYLNQSYTSKDGIFDNSPWVDENFNTIQIWSKIPITERLQVFTLIPFQHHSRELTTGKEEIQGLGDITLMGMYTLYQTHKDSVALTHKFQMGGGVKMPTGKFNEANNLGTVNQSFQVGTGSWDYLLVADYVIQKNNLGLNLLLDYTFKTENSKNYQYGNQLNYGGLFFYLLEANTLKIMPNLGLVGEVYESNKQHGQVLPNTAGDVLFSKFGFEIGKDKFSLGMSAMLPVTQHLAGSNIEANYRLMFNLNYSL